MTVDGLQPPDPRLGPVGLVSDSIANIDGLVRDLERFIVVEVERRGWSPLYEIVDVVRAKVPQLSAEAVIARLKIMAERKLIKLLPNGAVGGML